MAEETQQVKKRGGRPKQSPLLKLNIETPKDTSIEWDRSTDVISVDTTTRDVNVAIYGVEVLKENLIANLESTDEATKRTIQGWICDIAGKTKLGILRNRDWLVEEDN